MNLFITSKCPIECAKFLDDKRVISQCKETGQMLASALRLHGYEGDDLPKLAHPNHPCTKWVAQTRMNYLWTVQHLQALCTEYTSRYGKHHKYEGMIVSLLAKAHHVPAGFQTPFANCAANASLGVSYKSMVDVTRAYQLYLNDRWDNDKRTPTWYGKSA